MTVETTTLRSEVEIRRTPHARFFAAAALRRFIRIAAALPMEFMNPLPLAAIPIRTNTAAGARLGPALHPQCAIAPSSALSGELFTNSSHPAVPVFFRISFHVAAPVSYTHLTLPTIYSV